MKIKMKTESTAACPMSFMIIVISAFSLHFMFIMYGAGYFLSS